MSLAVQPWNALRASLTLQSGGSGLVDRSPTVAILRRSDNKYLQADNSWNTAYHEHVLVELDQENLPGAYEYAITPSAIDYDAGREGYLFCVSEGVSGTLLYEPVVPMPKVAWEEERTSYQVAGSFGHDLAFLSLQAPGAEGDVTIVVRDQTSDAVEGALVRVFDSTGSTLVSRGYTDSVGNITFGLPVGSYKVRVTKSGTDFSSSTFTTITVVANDSVTPQLDYLLPASAALGDVIAIRGRYFGADSEVIFGTEDPVLPTSVSADGTLLLVAVPGSITDVMPSVWVQKPDPAGDPEDRLVSNALKLQISD